MSAHRTELFSDAVLAIALTLLVLDLSIRTFQASQLQGTLLHMWPTYVAFIAAFFYVSVMWINHHFAFARLNSVDRGYLTLGRNDHHAGDVRIGPSNRFEWSCTRLPCTTAWFWTPRIPGGTTHYSAPDVSPRGRMAV